MDQEEAFPEDVEYDYLDYEPRKSVSIKQGATYSEIKDWILAQYGFKVSSLYVAQIKDKCGIKELGAYNHGKGEHQEHHVPNCSPEKEEAIMAAFKHFNMI